MAPLKTGQARVLAGVYAAFLVDVDGVVLRGEEPVSGVPEVLRELKKRGVRLGFVTNNSTRTPEALAALLRRAGVDVTADSIVTSAQAAASRVKELVPEGSRVLVVGGEGIRAALAAAGLYPVPGTEARGDEAGVVVGLDTAFTYDTLAAAQRVAMQTGVLVATNADATFPASEGLLPGAGSLVAAVEVASGVRAEVVGKPRPDLVLEALRRLGNPVPALMVGDRCDTDVVAAHSSGVDAALVTYGAGGWRSLVAAEDWPEYVLDDLEEVLRPVEFPLIRPATARDLTGLAEMVHGAGGKVGRASRWLAGAVVAEASGRLVAYGRVIEGEGLVEVVRREGEEKAARLVAAALLREAEKQGAKVGRVEPKELGEVFTAPGASPP